MFASNRKFRLFLFLMLFTVGLMPNRSLAQQHKVDSLESLISNQLHDTIRIQTMVQLVRLYLNKDHQKAEELSWGIISLSQKLNDEKYEATGYNLLGIVYSRMSFPSDTILVIYDRAHELTKKINDKLLEAKILINKGLLYNNIGLDDQALDLYNQALDIAEKNGANHQKFITLLNIGMMAYKRKDFDRALVYLPKALKIAKELNRRADISYIHYCIGIVYIQLKKADTALIYLEKALEEAQDVNANYDIVKTLAEIGVAYILKNEYEIGLKSLSKSYKLAKDLDYSLGQIYALNQLVFYSIETNDYEKAIKYADEGLKFIGKGSQIATEEALYKYLTIAFSNLGNYQKAFEAKEKYHILKDSIYNIEKEEHINDLLIKYETQQKEAKNKLLSVVVSQQKQKLHLLIAILVASIALLISFLSFSKVRQVKKIEQMRVGIAQDLHDEVGSKLTLIQIYINKLLGVIGARKSKEIIDNSKEINKVMKDTHFAISDLVWAISPTTNTMKDLINRLNDYADDFLGPAEIAYNFDYNDFKFDKKLDPNLRQNIVLFFKEALNNILKHTNSSVVNIKLYNVGKTFNLEIINEFDSKKTSLVSGGNGLKNMQFRAKKIGGQIKIDEQANRFKICLSSKAFA